MRRAPTLAADGDADPAGAASCLAALRRWLFRFMSAGRHRCGNEGSRHRFDGAVQGRVRSRRKPLRKPWAASAGPDWRWCWCCWLLEAPGSSGACADEGWFETPAAVRLLASYDYDVREASVRFPCRADRLDRQPVRSRRQPGRPIAARASGTVASLRSQSATACIEGGL